MIQVDHHHVPNGDGWLLSLRRTVDREVFEKNRNPLLIIPGYGMNSYIFSFHPTGPSMEASLAAKGFEVWSADLRGQGRSRRESGSSRYHLSDLVMKDLFAAVHGVLEKTNSSSQDLDLVGCSLGGSMIFAYAACVRDNHVGRIVNMGGAVRWVDPHPVLRMFSAAPGLVGMIPVIGTRHLAAVALPVLKYVPWVLSIYLHPDIVDLEQSHKLLLTVENPNRHLNRDIVEWVRRRDLVVHGVNVAEQLGTMQHPLLTVLANADGIVPRQTALWPHMNIGAARRDLLEVGTYSMPIAHADMFVSKHAPEMVFAPLADWLAS